MTEEIKKKPSTADRIEIFAQAIVAGKSQADAYRAAYPVSLKWKDESVHPKASHMSKNDTVLARVQELRKTVEKKTLWSIEESVKGLKEIVADDSYKGSERIAAIKELNVMFGYNKFNIDHSSTDGTMTPKPALDVSKLSAQTMKELLEARAAK
jgi:phage terminase small subunit